MNQPVTYELEVGFSTQSLETKEYFKAWLDTQAIQSFVECYRDNLDLFPDAYDPLSFEQEAACDPIVIYRFDKKELEELKTRADSFFPNQLDFTMRESATIDWQEGWKQSFKPLYSKRCVIYPPWDSSLQAECLETYVPIIIEPAMAFGTGQHPTTMLCLNALENLLASHDIGRLADIGTGTGILAIAAKKLGVASVFGTDTDGDAIRAAESNASLNGVTCDFSLGSLLPDQDFDVTIANILKPFFIQSGHELINARFLILSGFLEEDEADILASMPPQFNLIGRTADEQWCCLVLQNNDSTQI